MILFIRRTRARNCDAFYSTSIPQAADVALTAAKSHDERAVPLLLRGAALGRLGFYADSMAALNAVVELEGKLEHDTYAPPFALYELGAVHCAQGQIEEAAGVFKRCAAVSYDFNFEVGTRRACLLLLD